MKLHHYYPKSTMCWVNVETWACGSRNDVLLCRMLVVAVSDKYFLLRGLSDDLLFLCNFLIFGPILGHLVTWENYPIFSINFLYSTFGSLFSEAFLFVLHYFSQILLYPFCTNFYALISYLSMTYFLNFLRWHNVTIYFLNLYFVYLHRWCLLLFSLKYFCLYT